jgi:hypothetical protein
MRFASTHSRSVFVPFILVLAIFCPACSSNQKPLYPVRGQVLVQGRPAAHAQITFHPVGDQGPEAVRPVGSVDENGYFTLTSFKQGDGAPEGEYRVTIHWFLATKSGGTGSEYVSVNYVPDQYGRAETSGLRASVGKGDNQLPPFQLLSR